MAPSRWPVLTFTLQLLFIFADAESETIKASEGCTDFQSASLLRGSNLKVQFLLFPSSNPRCGQLLLVSEAIQNSSFNTSLGTKIIIHGFRALGTKPSWINGLIEALLQANQANIIAVDWVQGATAAYPTAVENVMKLGLEISTFVRRLLATGVPETSIHLIGVSLGAHVAGLVGHFYDGMLGRITGLDPAGPKFTRASQEERLDPGDALFVEAIHTDADNFGIRIPVGHIDYYVNGGKDQPGCPRFISSGYRYLICDHMRAVHFYISALEGPCPMMAFPCSSYQNFLAGGCLDCFNPFLLSCPTIGLLDNGGVDMKKLPMEVKVYLATAASPPYCVYHSLVEFSLQEITTLDINIEITFLSSNSSFRTSITIPKQQTLGKGLLMHSVPLCQIERVTLLSRPSKTWSRKKNGNPIVGQFCTAQLPVDKGEMFCLSQTLSLTGNTLLSHRLTVTCA
ncbi:phospholipase A1 member A isoform X1 [Anolis carolinensis]|uniref:Phospholipase A1 member A n=2 Tax=Anolis carolinensis TaxID=28377 RepID=H9G7N4_ANOCA|nr:PREDICTED: phospholipase A1 member A [Anolis carolinensis]|eukprot:XP_003226827.1 PREDICTED: phospholipase A1 member A [Anolis carolinensis]